MPNGTSTVQGAGASIATGYIDPISLDHPAPGCGWGSGLDVFATKDALSSLLAMPEHDAIGVAMAFLLDCADRDPQKFQRILDTVATTTRHGSTVRNVLLGVK